MLDEFANAYFIINPPLRFSNSSSEILMGRGYSPLHGSGGPLGRGSGPSRKGGGPFWQRQTPKWRWIPKWQKTSKRWWRWISDCRKRKDAFQCSLA
jgi:hypothetical protein